MKKLLIFVGATVFLIAAEYFFLTEVFTCRRLPVIAGSLLVVILCIVIFLRFFKASVTSLQR